MRTALLVACGIAALAACRLWAEGDAPAEAPPKAPFADLVAHVESGVQGWSGPQEELRGLFNAERKRLGAAFERSLPAFLGRDVDRHYHVALFLEDADAERGLPEMPYLSMLLMEQGLVLLEAAPEAASRADLRVGLSISAAILGRKLGLDVLASKHKRTAEAILAADGDLRAAAPAQFQKDWKLYEAIPEK